MVDVDLEYILVQEGVLSDESSSEGVLSRNVFRYGFLPFDSENLEGGVFSEVIDLDQSTFESLEDLEQSRPSVFALGTGWINDADLFVGLNSGQVLKFNNGHTLSLDLKAGDMPIEDVLAVPDGRVLVSSGDGIYEMGSRRFLSRKPTGRMALHCGGVVYLCLDKKTEDFGHLFELDSKTDLGQLFNREINPENVQFLFANRKVYCAIGACNELVDLLLLDFGCNTYSGTIGKRPLKSARVSGIRDDFQLFGVGDVMLRAGSEICRWGGYRTQGNARDEQFAIYKRTHSTSPSLTSVVSAGRFGIIVAEYDSAAKTTDLVLVNGTRRDGYSRILLNEGFEGRVQILRATRYD